MFAIGSIIDLGSQDATIWGSGLLNNNSQSKLGLDSNRGRKLDIRCVRGPYTRTILKNVGYECPDIYGDPAIIMPLIFNPDVKKEYDVSVITLWRPVFCPYRKCNKNNNRLSSKIPTICCKTSQMICIDFRGII